MPCNVSHLIWMWRIAKWHRISRQLNWFCRRMGCLRVLLKEHSTPSTRCLRLQRDKRTADTFHCDLKPLRWDLMFEFVLVFYSYTPFNGRPASYTYHIMKWSICDVCVLCTALKILRTAEWVQVSISSHTATQHTYIHWIIEFSRARPPLVHEYEHKYDPTYWALFYFIHFIFRLPNDFLFAIFLSLLLFFSRFRFETSKK